MPLKKQETPLAEIKYQENQKGTKYNKLLKLSIQTIAEKI
ncbi:hypothetical protein MPNT_430010 [Candidatus Methylacidithermus pantelleriae]|uniref:Uncharacterized protein n=1 Tax=Candidatus Methylacidithermus pantelleriae TaxID=2744239 RepID=A0A8J2BNH9_9BACT|nr:hypothetical protein MPNT_430010 [Candidatus Methylacidithermus pantelleriae]